MKPYLFSALFCIAMLISSCSNDEPDFEPEPVYTEITSVEEITAHTARVTFKFILPVTQETSGQYFMDKKIVWRYGAFYTTDTTQNKSRWDHTREDISDTSGIYSVVISDLLPSTKYYVKSWVLTTPEGEQMGLMNESAATLAFETLPE